MTDFDSWFRTASGGHSPRPWQRALAGDDGAACGSRLVRIPTGFGKTLGCLAAWSWHRISRADARWPRRLVWMLPMRTLVEQTADEASALLERLGLLWAGGDHAGRVGVHLLMGGADAGAWHLHPEEAAVLIGTQDMLLSRALNRGYGAARARWPIDFGLLSQDALWVLDEVQLMGTGFATALQLAAFRQGAPALRPTHTWAMSATLQRAWVERSPDTGALVASLTGVGLSDADLSEPLWTSSRKPLQRVDPETPAALATRILEAHANVEGPAPLTLVVCNTVDRARAVYDALAQRRPDATLHLAHSRFRGAERGAFRDAVLRAQPDGARIVVATQVVEAGVDLSADLLVTELCPWPSLVQRLGRLARRGGEGRAMVVRLDTGRSAAPYEAGELDAAWDALALLDDGSPRALEAFEVAHPGLIPGLYPFEPRHLVLREEVAELFDTTADLSGGDLDVSRFIREGDERDVAVAWLSVARDPKGRAVAPSPATRPVRDALCAVPFLAAQDWLCGKATATSRPRRLRPGVAAFVWDWLEERWRLAERSDLRPGAQVLVDAAAGGYHTVRGFDPTSRAPVPLIPFVEADRQERADSGADRDDLSIAAWQTIGFHGGAVAREVGCIAAAVELDGCDALPADEARRLLHLAARWHDLGKAHPAFQGAIGGAARPDRGDLAKAPDAAWRRERCMYRFGSPPELRPGLRHELASVLALFDVLVRRAPVDHPARLGELAAVVEALGGPRAALPAEGPPTAPAASSAELPSPVEQEVLDLGSGAFDLVAYLVCAHHGKLRARLHASPADQAAAVRCGSLPIRGIYDGDTLPSVALAGSEGAQHLLPPATLRLDPAALGVSPLTGRSWTERVDALREALGPFALAWLEAVLRAADVRASRDGGLADPALVGGGNALPMPAGPAPEVAP